MKSCFTKIAVYLSQYNVWLRIEWPGFDPLPRDKARPGSDADHSPPFSAEVKKEYTLDLPSPQTPLGV
jgi:hypothetical protein